MHRFTILILLGLFICNCKDNEAKLNVDAFLDKDTLYTEQYRPQFHFTPEANWMNDPNGLVYNDGVYHMFYQYYPDDTVWGPMHWGHAVSKDLLKWKHKPIALYPDSLGYIFSGSAVIDRNNTSGFGSLKKPPMVAIFTYHLSEGELAGKNDFQTQGIAYSLDNGDTWEKYKGNPVVPNEGIKDFRDPKVFWHDATNQWIMILVAGDHAKFYQSKDLKKWELSGEFGKEFGAHGGVWECPDLFKLPVEGTEEERWVLIISINPGGPNGGSATQYFIGNFDGNKFIADHLDTRWLDYGTDNYAGITYNHAPNNQRVFIGWMSNWTYARDTPTEKWRSAMTLPRKLSLYKEGNEIKLRNYPIDGFAELHGEELNAPTKFEDPILIKTNKRQGADINFMADLSKPLSVRLSNKARQAVVFSVNPDKKEMSFDRSASGEVKFKEEFAAKKQIMPYSLKEKKVEVRIVLDASSIEIFVERGKYVFTALVFPSETYSRMQLNVDDDHNIENLEINLVKSVWTNEK